VEPLALSRGHRQSMVHWRRHHFTPVDVMCNWRKPPWRNQTAIIQASAPLVGPRSTTPERASRG